MVDSGAVAACRAALVDTEQETDDPLTGGTLIGTRVGRVVGLLITVVATAALVALTWFGTFTEAGWQRDEAEAHLEADVTSQATLFEDQVQRDLMELNQTLGVLGHAWEIDPSHFSLLKWRDLLVMTNTFSPDIYIANEHGVVRDDTVPEEVGRNVSDRDFFRDLSERIYDDGKMFVGQSVVGEPVREWHMNLVRPLHHPDGSFAGIIGAALRLDSIAGFYRMANIGSHGVIAVVGLGQAKLRVAAGSNAPEPGSSIADTEMYKALESKPDGVWIGRTALDGVERVHAFHRIPDTDLAVVVGVDLSEAMAGARARTIAAYVFAGVITLALLALAAMLLVALRSSQRREAALGRDHAVLATTNSELELAKAVTDNKTAQLEATLAGMTDGVAMVDGAFRLVEWNPRFPEFAGVPASMLRVGLPMEEIVRAQAVAGQFGPVDDIEAEAARRMALLRTGRIAGTTERTRPDGSVIELRRNRMPDGGFVTLYTDITARKQTENSLRHASNVAAAASRATSRFVAIVSHEIRAPLNALLNSLTLLAASGMAATQQVLLDTARQSGDALSSLINDVLEMSRMDAGQLALRPSRFHLRSLIESVIEMFSAQAAERRIVLRTAIGGGVPDELYEDPGRLRQVLINLLSNAVKFAAPGEVRITVESQRTQGGEPWLRFAVRDCGPVIPPDGRARLFEPFSRLVEGTEGAPVGTGLGLTICQHLVSLMGGDIGCAVWSMGDRDAGNEFWLTLPVKPLPGGLRHEPPETEVRPRRAMPRTRILLVEDILANQLVTATQLRREGHLVDIASSGPEAISVAASRPYDLVLMDIFMPGMDGLETTQRIRGLGGPAAHVPIIALTASVDADGEAQCLDAGMSGILSKPVSVSDLLDVIARYVWPYRSDPRPAEAASTELPDVLSASRLDELRATLPADTLAGLVEECLVELTERVGLLQDALRQGAADAIFAQAHAMAGMSAEYGMAALELRLRTLMRALRDQPDAAAAIGEELEVDIARASEALREALRIEMV